MKVRDELKQQRDRLIRKVGLFAAEHPELSFKQIGARFGVRAEWVSRAARAIGMPPRRRGRKKANERMARQEK